jgi:hypothetical protein
MKGTASSNMPLLIYDIPGTSEKTIFREALAPTALTDLSSTGVIG